MIKTHEKINVLFLMLSLDIGGTERHIFNLVSKLNKKKFNPIVCCLYKLGLIGKMLVDGENIKIYHNLMKNRCDITGVWKLIRILKNENIHIVFITNSPLTVFWGFICTKLTGINATLTRITVTKPVSHALRRLVVNNLMLSFFNIIIAQAHSHKEYLIKAYGLKDDKIEVIYNGVELDHFLPTIATQNQRHEIGIPEGTLVIGVVARLCPEKGVSLFLHAARKILDYFANSHFIIVGDGSERERLENITCELSIQSNVHFLGMRKDIPQIISLFDVAVMSSDIENFSNAVLEYMAASKPVVATNVGSIAEQVIDGETGFLVPSGDPEALANAVLKLLKDRNLAKKMGEAGRKRVKEKFTLQKMVAKYESIFSDLINRN